MTRSGFCSCKIPLRITLIKAAAIPSIANAFLKEGTHQFGLQCQGNVTHLIQKKSVSFVGHFKATDLLRDSAGESALFQDRSPGSKKARKIQCVLLSYSVYAL
jgi:hypothetical protein